MRVLRAHVIWKVPKAHVPDLRAQHGATGRRRRRRRGGGADALLCSVRPCSLPSHVMLMLPRPASCTHVPRHVSPRVLNFCLQKCGLNKSHPSSIGRKKRARAKKRCCIACLHLAFMSLSAPGPCLTGTGLIHSPEGPLAALHSDCLLRPQNSGREGAERGVDRAGRRELEATKSVAVGWRRCFGTTLRP